MMNGLYKREFYDARNLLKILSVQRTTIAVILNAQENAFACHSERSA